MTIEAFRKDGDTFQVQELIGRGKRLKILAIGFIPPPLGGISVSFKIFCDIVSIRDDVDLMVINVSGMNQRNQLFLESLGLLVRLWHNIAKSDVVTLYCSTEQVPSLAAATWIFCRLLRKSFILRMGAGLDHRELGPIIGRVAEFVAKRVDLFLVQTKLLVETCRLRGFTRVDWYPTSRLAGLPMASRAKCRRFVFIGHVRPSKGMEELIAAAERLPKSAIVDVYGPFFDGIDTSIFEGRKHIFYKGVLDPDKVVGTMREYDAFVLPSKAFTEGYPGAILEALSVGMPIISTTVGGIPEILDEKCSILVEPGDKRALADAMHRLVNNEDLYHELCRGALEVRNRFSAEYWANWLVDQCARMSWLV